MARRSSREYDEDDLYREDDFQEDDTRDDEDLDDEDADLDPDDEDPDADPDDEDPDAEEDDFADVDDPEVKGRLERAADRKAKLLSNKYKAKMGRGVKNLVEQLEAAGIQVDSNGRIIPPEAPRRRRQAEDDDEPAPRERKPAAPAEPQFTEANMPDPALETEEWQKWFAGYQKQQNAAQTAQMTALQMEIAEGKAERAVRTAHKVLPSYGMGEIAKHPQFDAMMEKALIGSGIPFSQWKDPDVLAKIAGVISVDLRKAGPARRGTRNSFVETLLDEEDERPVRRRRRDEEDDDEPAPRRRERPEVRRQGDRARRSALARDSQVQVGVSRSSGRAPRTEGKFSALDRAVAKQLGIPVAEAASLDDDTGESYFRNKGRSGRRTQQQRR